MPGWNHTINLAVAVSYYKETGDIPGTAELAIEVIERSGWLGYTPYPISLRDRLDQLSRATTRGEYEAAFDGIYDIADEDRVWINTR